MLKEVRPQSYQKYLNLSILGSITEEFSLWSRQLGYTTGTIKGRLGHVSHIDVYLLNHGVHSLKDLTHGILETAWQDFNRHSHQKASTVHLLERFLNETRRLSPLVPPPKTQTDIELDYFSDYLENVRGLSVSTIKTRLRGIQGFLDSISYDTDSTILTRLTLKEIEGYLSDCSQKLSRRSLQQMVSSLRAFLRFEYGRDILPKPLHIMIDTPKMYRLEQLPCSLSWETVEAFLTSIDRTTASGIRDYTMFFLAATYGLRSSEIVLLSLDDIDWRSCLIRVTQHKTGHQLILPITDEAGEVLIEYLKKGRPRLPFRELFLHVKAPNGPLHRTAFTRAFHRRVHRSGLDIPNYGPRCLRHSCAVNLLRKGISVKTIGDLLGHRNADSTYAYLRLGIDDLRKVALPVPVVPPETLGISRIHTAHSYSQKGKPPKSKVKSEVVLKSFLAGEIHDYIKIKRSMGREYKNESIALYSFDAFLASRYPQAKSLTPEMFANWAITLHYLAPKTRRDQMRIVRNLCLYHRRSQPEVFVPDTSTFPANNQPIAPYIFSESEIARLLNATSLLLSYPYSPLRPQTIRLAIILLSTTGIRIGELLRLTLKDINLDEATLMIQSAKFHKSRIIPLSPSTTLELKEYLTLRQTRHLPMETNSHLIWNSWSGPQGKSYCDDRFRAIWTALCSALKIFSHKGAAPRIHDLRHSFAVNVLHKCYHDGGDVQAMLPLLSLYMGHVSIASTHYYLKFIEKISSEASQRFYQSFGKTITSSVSSSHQEPMSIPGSGGAK